ncbi:VanZ family protein [Roseburia sp. 499]|uniref:VanZ family protein n=1 Tax=Roseburia sp. 499 TaxID=1261634 RepID=UPI000950C22F|nr:VanZ family protein [Roseburia sp. 499]WVK69671.1 VanZ family protein [Roseburia sp. 499]
MEQYILAIKMGVAHFPVIATFLIIPILLFQVISTKKLNLVRVGMCFLFLFYMMCTYALIIFPLPDAATAETLSSHNIQLIPFHFIADIVRETPFEISNIHTYLPALFHRTILQVVLNVVMVIPFGMFLAYYFNFNTRKVALSSFLLSCFFELSQLTGLFFMFSGSYRLCDVDDLMANTLGGIIGCLLVQLCSKWLPNLRRFDIDILKPLRSLKHRPV